MGGGCLTLSLLLLAVATSILADPVTRIDASAIENEYILSMRWENIPREHADVFIPANTEMLKDAIRRQLLNEHDIDIGWSNRIRFTTEGLVRPDATSAHAYVVITVDPHQAARLLATFGATASASGSPRAKPLEARYSSRAESMRRSLRLDRMEMRTSVEQESPSPALSSEATRDAVMKLMYNTDTLQTLANSLFSIDWRAQAENAGATRGLKSFRILRDPLVHEVLAEEQEQDVDTGNDEDDAVPQAVEQQQQQQEEVFVENGLTHHRFRPLRRPTGQQSTSTENQLALPRMTLALEPNRLVHANVIPAQLAKENAEKKAKAAAATKVTTGVVKNTNKPVKARASASSSAGYGQQQIWSAGSLPSQFASISAAQAADQAWLYVVDVSILPTHTQFNPPGRANIVYDYYNGEYPNGCNDHATHVTGIATGNNVGVFPGATIWGITVLDCTGSGTMDAVLAGVQAITSHCTANGGKARRSIVINMSLGGQGSDGVGLGSALATVRSACDAITVVAAGNSETDACTFTPAGLKSAAQGQVLTIGATDQTETVASFSNVGTCLDMFAPGVNINSSIATSTTAFGLMSGTSMSTPAVSGVALANIALTRSKTGSWSSPSGLFVDYLQPYMVSIAIPQVKGAAQSNSPNKLAQIAPGGGGYIPDDSASLRASLSVALIAGTALAAIALVL